MKHSRRQFLATTVPGTALLMARADARSPQSTSPAPSPRIYRAAVIGHTGAGDYGHGYERIFADLDNVRVEALSDPDPAGRQAAAARAGAARTYADYREMLERERPDLVSIAPRQPGEHREMALAAIEAGAHLFIEKPLTETPAEADAILAAAAGRSTKIVVAHNRRWTPEFVQAGEAVRRGLIGSVREVQIHGKQDRRVGGEDLIVLGTHDFDLMRLYFGDPTWCYASVTVDGRDITAADVRQGAEPITVAGDTVRALFGFPGNLGITWSSVRAADGWNLRSSPRERWAFEILGTKGIVAYQSGVGFRWSDSPFFLRGEEGTGWQPLPAPEAFQIPESRSHPIRSLIAAIETGGEPVCSGADGRWAIEMVAAVYESQRTKSRVSFPLEVRDHPLRRMS